MRDVFFFSSLYPCLNSGLLSISLPLYIEILSYVNMVLNIFVIFAISFVGARVSPMIESHIN